MALAHDYRSKIKAAGPDPATLNPPIWVFQQSGNLPFDYEVDVNSVSGNSPDGSVTMRIRFRAAYIHTAIPYILGYGTRSVSTTIPPPAGVSALSRVLPMVIPFDVGQISRGSWPNGPGTIAQQRWSMYARSLTWTLEGLTGQHSDPTQNLEWIPAGYDGPFFAGGDRQLIAGSGATPFGNPPRSFDIVISRYEWAVCTITFAHFPYDLANDLTTGFSPYNERDRYMVGTFTSGNEYNTLPTGMIIWAPGPPTDTTTGLPRSSWNAGFPINDTRGGVVVPIANIQLTWYRVPSNDFDNQPDAISLALGAIQVGIGSVNNAAFTLPIYKAFITFNPGTLLLAPPSTPAIPRIGPIGQVETDIVYNFMYRPQGWNYLQAPDGSYNPVVVATLSQQPPAQGGQPTYSAYNLLYKAYDFRQLFLGSAQG